MLHSTRTIITYPAVIVVVVIVEKMIMILA